MSMAGFQQCWVLKGLFLCSGMMYSEFVPRAQQQHLQLLMESTQPVLTRLSVDSAALQSSRALPGSRTTPATAAAAPTGTRTEALSEASMTNNYADDDKAGKGCGCWPFARR
jgi:hypothetical protein